jgi:hypothetical protein
MRNRLLKILLLMMAIAIVSCHGLRLPDKSYVTIKLT